MKGKTISSLLFSTSHLERSRLMASALPEKETSFLDSRRLKSVIQKSEVLLRAKERGGLGCRKIHRREALPETGSLAATEKRGWPIGSSSKTVKLIEGLAGVQGGGKIGFLSLNTCT